MKETFIIGVISDTHGLLRENAIKELEDCNLIIHGGDIGGLHILDKLSNLAKVYAVRGNNDRGEEYSFLPKEEFIEYKNKNIYVIHDINDLSIDPMAADINILIYGHSHKPFIEIRQGILYINPGSAGPRRFTLPISLGKIYIREEDVEARIINLAEN